MMKGLHNLSKNNADGVSRRKQIRGMFYGTESYRKGCGDFRRRYGDRQSTGIGIFKGRGTGVYFWAQTCCAGKICAGVLAAGHEIYYEQLDITDTKGLESYAARVFEKFGHLDIWVNNAGVDCVKEFSKFTQADWDRVMKINLEGVFHGTQIAA